MAWTGLTAAALFAAAERGWRGGAIARFLGVYVVAVLLHTTWDSVGSTLVYVVLAAISLGLLTYTAHRLAAPDRGARPSGSLSFGRAAHGSR